jgi:hypothetical protein
MKKIISSTLITSALIVAVGACKPSAQEMNAQTKNVAGWNRKDVQCEDRLRPCCTAYSDARSYKFTLQLTKEDVDARVFPLLIEVESTIGNQKQPAVKLTFEHDCQGNESDKEKRQCYGKIYTGTLPGGETIRAEFREGSGNEGRGNARVMSLANEGASGWCSF